MIGWLHRLVDGLRARRRQRRRAADDLLKARYHLFRSLLAGNNRAVDLLTEIAVLLRMRGTDAALARRISRLIDETAGMIDRLDQLASGGFRGLYPVHQRLAAAITSHTAALAQPRDLPLCLGLDRIDEPLREIVGNKAANLVLLAGHNGLPIPDGFVITAPACRLLLEHEDLSLRLAHLFTEKWSAGNGDLSAETAARAQRLLEQAPLPPELITAATEAARPFFAAGKALAVRSSSSSEDGRRHSFAGQFTSVLNVRDETQLLQAIRQVAASSFTPRSLSYRSHAGLDPLSFDMAILCLEMIEARAAGILLTRDPGEPASDRMLLSAVPGLGEAAVAGSAATDVYLVDRDGSVDWQRSTVAAKERQLVASPEGGLEWQDLPAAERGRPVLDRAQTARLVAWGKKLEDMAGAPQDIEWAIDAAGEVILQVRTLTGLGGAATEPGRPSSPPLLAGIGAAPGRATGRLLLVRGRRDLQSVPAGPTVLAMHGSFVDAAAILHRIAAVLVDLGSPADHLACVAREQGVPLICGLGDAGSRLAAGTWLTVDGGQGRVYAANAEETAAAEAEWHSTAKGERSLPALPAGRRELRELVTALNLTDAYGPTFSILECRSLHDIVRFVHEKAVLAMFHAGDEILEGHLATVHVIETSVPFFVSVIDMGGGLAPTAGSSRRIAPETVASRPFRALWQGIVTPGLRWGPPPGGAPMGSVVSSFLTDQKSERPVGMPNYALVSRDYCNLNARMDFHFIMIDAVCGLQPGDNHIRFRFKGGGTAMARRRRRAACIAEIFEHFGFAVDVREDLINAVLQGAPCRVIEEKLVVVGRLLGFTRLLDAAMADDQTARAAAQAFLAGDYGLTRLERQT
ncbi:MAG: PEP/pyruvate-binding domain-containing protein [Thermodesulfobacteriota bacterium]